MKALLAACAFALTFPSVADAAQQWPFAFDAGLAPDSSTVEENLALGALSLPALPVSELQSLTTNAGTMTLWFWPENAALLQSAVTSGPGPMSWPSTPVMCAKTSAFTPPALLAADAGPACAEATAQIQADLSEPNLLACTLVEQPELYVYSYSPSDASTAVNSIEGMIGFAGEGLTHGDLPPEGLLPAGFVPTLREIIDKVRQATLAQGLQTSQAAFAEVGTLLSTQASCFDPAAAGQLQRELSDLNGELGSAGTYLTDLADAGATQSAQEDLCLAARSQVRPTLPFPSLTQSDREFLAFWLGGMYWRMRGGGLVPLGSTQEARLYFLDDAFTQIGTLVGGSDGASTAGPFYLEVVVDGWSQWMDMDSGDGGTRYDDLIGMTERGQREAQAGINTLSGYDAGALMTGGLQMGPGYYFGWWGLPGFTFDDAMTSPYSNLMDGPTAIGEFNMGAALALGLAHTLLPGKPTWQPPTVSLCAERSCGGDGCGGSCGTCPSGSQCSVAGVCEPGAPDAGSAPGADAGSMEAYVGDQLDGGPPDAGVDDAGSDGAGGGDGGGLASDAGVELALDGGPPVSDGGPQTAADAGPGDAGSATPPDGGRRPATDAGAVLGGDGGGAPPPSNAGSQDKRAATSGCGCSSSSPPDSTFMALALLGVAMLRRRHRSSLSADLDRARC